jgi:2-polyprenyl-3-methyl-5-hydroxy-6-metoxy-1,4-benzoquinol methylase
MGHQVTGIDLSRKGIEFARASCPEGRFEVLPADEHVLQNLNAAPFDLVFSVEVIEHLYDPKSFLRDAWRPQNREGCFYAALPFTDTSRILLSP